MRGVYITYWPAGGGRGQNPCRTGLAQGLDLCLKYGPRALCSQFYMSQGRLYVPREVDLADKTRVAALPSSCPPGQPPLGHIASLGTYRIVTRVPLGRIFRILSSSASSRPICLSVDSQLLNPVRESTHLVSSQKNSIYRNSRKDDISKGTDWETEGAAHRPKT